MIGVLPREVAQAVMVPTTLALGSWIGDVGKELPRVELVNVCPFCCVRSTETSPMCSMDQAATFLVLHYCWCLIPHNIVLAVDPTVVR